MVLVLGVLPALTGCRWFCHRCCCSQKSDSTLAKPEAIEPVAERPQVEWPDPICCYRGVDRLDGQAAEPLWFSDDRRERDRDRVSRLGRQLTEPLAGFMIDTSQPISFDVLDNELPRRHHSADGTIYVTTGLVRSAPSDYQLSGVLALELAELLQERDQDQPFQPSQSPPSWPEVTNNASTPPVTSAFFEQLELDTSSDNQPASPEVFQRARQILHQAELKGGLSGLR